MLDGIVEIDKDYTNENKQRLYLSRLCYWKSVSHCHLCSSEGRQRVRKVLYWKKGKTLSMLWMLAWGSWRWANQKQSVLRDWFGKHNWLFLIMIKGGITGLCYLLHYAFYCYFRVCTLYLLKKKKYPIKQYTGLLGQQSCVSLISSLHQEAMSSEWPMPSEFVYTPVMFTQKRAQWYMYFYKKHPCPWVTQDCIINKGKSQEKDR